MHFYLVIIRKLARALLKTGIIYLVIICNSIIAQESKNNSDGYNISIKWDFYKRGDTLGWSIPRPMMGVVNGGALWVKCYSSLLSGQAYYDPSLQALGTGDAFNNRAPYTLVSPENIGIKSINAKKLRMRVLNLSSETAGRLSWISTDDLNKDIGPVRFSMEPYSKKWQEIVCNLDEIPWSGEFFQLKLVMGLQGVRGDIYIDWIALTDGQPRIKPDKPDIKSEGIVPRISIPGITQSDFNEAFNVLDAAIVYDNLPNGFIFPYISPGGRYRSNWWLLDATLTIPALKWVNLNFCENMIRGFINVQSQNPDGRIDHHGGVVNRGAPADLSVLPDSYFVGASDVLRCTNNAQLKEEIYNSLSSYMGWWLSPVKRDKDTGLIMGYHEESLGMHMKYFPQTVAQVDLNVSIYLGCYILSDISRRFGYNDENVKYVGLADNLKQSINKYLWNDDRGAFLNYNLIDKNSYPYLLSHTFNPFVKNIATRDKQMLLLKKLVDPALFNWGKMPLTTLAKTDSNYTVVLGSYRPEAFDGDVSTLKNMFIINGLKDIGRHDLASELNWKTIQIFNANYYEFLEPNQGVGQGVHGYSWTAAQYIEAIIQNLFGIEYDHMLRRLTICPHIPNQLKDKELSISNLMLPGSSGNKLSLTLKETAEKTEMEIKVSGKIENDALAIFISHEGVNQKIKVQDKITKKDIPVFTPEEMNNTSGVRINLSNNNAIVISRQ